MARGAGKRFTSESARAAVLARHAARRAREARAATLDVKAADVPEVLDNAGNSGRPSLVTRAELAPISLSDLIEGPGGVLSLPRYIGQRSEPIAPLRGSAGPSRISWSVPEPAGAGQASDPTEVEPIEPAQDAQAAPGRERPSTSTTYLQTPRFAKPEPKPAPPVERVGPYVTCAGCGIRWPRVQDVERRSQHAVMRQSYPGVSEAEQANRARCIAFCEGRA